MSWCLRIPDVVLREVRADLSRPHRFASERVGFVEVALGNRGEAEQLILASGYLRVPDEDYIVDPSIGARIGAHAIRAAVERVLGGRVGLFHVHLHDHQGPPRFSPVDLAEIPPIVRSLRIGGRTQAYGALLLSKDVCTALAWLPGGDQPERGGRVTLITRPMRMFAVQDDHEQRDH